MLGNIGLMLHTGDLSMNEIVCLARTAESLGYEGFWPSWLVRRSASIWEQASSTSTRVPRCY